MNANTESLVDLGNHIAAKFADDVVWQGLVNGELVVEVATAAIAKVAKFVRDDASCLFKQVSDICGVDYPEREKRFEVVYNLLSVKHNMRLRLKTSVEEDAAVPSVSEIWPAANWFEREVWDMYGVFFTDHPDLRRILTDYGFEGHPLRKDFPLTGYVEVRYDDEQRRVVYEPVKLKQEFRSFDFLSPWEGGAMHQLPGDEKATAEKPAGEGK